MLSPMGEFCLIGRRIASARPFKREGKNLVASLQMRIDAITASQTPWQGRGKLGTYHAAPR
jgi:hypothetical protein